MPQLSHYQYVKLGMNLEYLRGVTSSSIKLTANLASFPELMENVPAQRFDATKVMAVIRSPLIQLEEMGLRETRSAADALAPMLTQVETYINENPTSSSIVLQDGFANKLVSVAKQTSLVLKQELASRVWPQSCIGSTE
jgi:hypothetical protein